ncbi:MAG: GreA/GreB family elongation factor [Planctomycetes bacterium]|nr:GreA/GreB family elongation factor [Planctomycetota bacterium]
MAYDQYLVNRIKGAVRARDLQKVEELWVDLQASTTPLGSLKVFFETAAEVAERGDKERAAELLLLLRQDLKNEGREDELFEVLRRAVGYSGRVRAVREDLVAQYRRVYGERPGFEAVLSRTDLAGEGSVRQSVQALDEAFSFTEGDFVFHTRGWGVGKVIEAHPETGEFVIDFEPGQPQGKRMDAGMALKSLERRGADDLDVLLWQRPERVSELAQEEPLELLKSALRASGGKLQARDLRDRLTPVIEKSGWTKFWAKARKLAKHDPQIEVGPAPRSVIQLREEELSRDDEMLEKLHHLRTFKKRIVVLRKELVAAKKDGGETPGWIAQGLSDLAKAHGKEGSIAKVAADLEYALWKNELAETFPDALPEVSASEPQIDPDTGEPLASGVAPHLVEPLQAVTEENVCDVFKEMHVPDYRKQAVQMLCTLDAARGAKLASKVLLDPAPVVWTSAVKALKRIGRDDLVLDAVNSIVIKPRSYGHAYASFAKARLTGKIDILPERGKPEIVAKAISVLDAMVLMHKESGDRKKKAELKTTIDAMRGVFNLKGQRVLYEVVNEGSEHEVRRLLQLVRQSPALTDTILRATEGFVAERFPEMLTQGADSHDAASADDVLFTTEEGKRRKERELDQLMNVEFEKIKIEIGKALDFGDISENAELDAAREKQQRLAEQIERIQSQLEIAKVIDFDDVETSRVTVGTRVTVTHAENGETVTYTILGPWDLTESDPTIISHMSPMAKGLLGKEPGDAAQVQLPSGEEAEYKVDAIDRVVFAS